MTAGSWKLLTLEWKVAEAIAAGVPVRMCCAEDCVCWEEIQSVCDMQSMLRAMGMGWIPLHRSPELELELRRWHGRWDVRNR